MKKVFIIHGAFGDPQENWFPWLKAELKKLDCRVFIPSFPTPQGQTLDNWLNVFIKYKEELDVNSILVGHSIGAAFLLNILEQLDRPIKTTFLIAGFVRLLNNKEVDNINETFVVKDFNWDKIRANSQDFYIYQSDNDPYVPMECAEELGKNLGVEPIIIPDAGHFNEQAGYTKFGRLLEDIKK